MHTETTQTPPGAKLASVGLASEAVAAYIKGGEPLRGVECCVALHRCGWRGGSLFLQKQASRTCWG